MLKNILMSYKGFNEKQYKLIFLLYFLFFLANGPLQGSLSLLVDSLGFRESYFHGLSRNK